MNNPLLLQSKVTTNQNPSTNEYGDSVTSSQHYQPFKKLKVSSSQPIEIVSLDSSDDENEQNTSQFSINIPKQEPQLIKESSDELEIVGERNLIPMPGAFNQQQQNQIQPKQEIKQDPFYVPPLPPQQQIIPPQQQLALMRTQKNDLQSKNVTYTHEIAKLTTELNKLTSTSVIIEQRYNMERNNIDNIKNLIRSATSENIGNLHGILKLHENRSIHLQHELNKYQTHLNNMQRKIELFNGKIRQNISIIRNLTHRTNASTNVYEAEIYRDNYRGAEVDIDLQNLLDNIRSEEIPEDGLESTPEELAVNLMKHQRLGLTWLKRMEASSSKGGILADDMGLGKTIQALALILANKPPADYKYKTTLIIAPVSLLRQWASEIDNKIKPSFNIHICIYHGDDKKKMSTFNKMSKYDVVLTSYTTLQSEWKKHYLEELKSQTPPFDRKCLPEPHTGGKSYTSPFFDKNSHFFRIILDEAQNIKNKFAIASRAVYYLSGETKFCLSGTPMQNNLDELYPLLRFLRIKPYSDEEKFRYDIILPTRSNSDQYDEWDAKQSFRKLRALLASILLRRTKDSLIDGQPILQLPTKHINKDFVELEGEEEEYYKSIEEKIQRVAKKLFNNHIKTAPILALLLRLRQACCHSYLVEIGQLKQEEAKTEDGKIFKDWKKMIRLTNELDIEVKNTVLQTINSNVGTPDEDLQSVGVDLMLTCQKCFEPNNSPVIFSECGHMICKTCFIEMFNITEDREENEAVDDVRCIECDEFVKQTHVIDYKIFKAKHIENHDNLEKFAKSAYTNWKNQRSNEKIIKEFVARDEFLNPSAKIEKCIDLIHEIEQRNPGEKIIIFSQFVSLFDIMKLVLKHECIRFLQYDGSMTLEQKNSTIKHFYQNNEIKVLLISLRAGNVGLTLTCANHVIIMDPFWNPFVEEQAMDRAHRIGQEKEVHVHKILIENTVESRIQELQEHKKKLIGAALNEKEMRNITKLGSRELGFLFGLNTLH
ncbi:unnamed protein product [Candida verbasci]|uniref:Uncharacterized protein n=1 Tax=Candida verbasci TaxID=1227364 RepID=A0A9W4XI20_9ASCO|nr:unnamed protein product [Candida verbasci]